VFIISCKCVNSPNLFCYVCGEFTPKSLAKSITPIVKKAFELYFGCKYGNQTRAGHHIHVAGDARGIYVTGSKALTSQFLFAVCMVWRKQKNNLTICYFCLTKIDGHNSKSKHTI